MNKPRIYVDMSVLTSFAGGEFASKTQNLWRRFVESECRLVASEDALLDDGGIVQTWFCSLDSNVQSSLERTSRMQECVDLAEAYLHDDVAGGSQGVAYDAAMAVIARVDVLASWDHERLVNLRCIRAFNAINIKLGYHMLEIRTPQAIYPVDEHIPREYDCVASVRAVRDRMSAV